MPRRAEKPRELDDLEACQSLMAGIEGTCNSLAAYGSEFVGRSWCTDNEANVKVSAIYEETVKALRAAYRGLSVAEEILEQEATSLVPVRRPGVVRRLLLGGA